MAAILAMPTLIANIDRDASLRLREQSVLKYTGRLSKLAIFGEGFAAANFAKLNTNGCNCTSINGIQ
ncbi:MAG: hypothetical protein H0X30_34485 [Anaerolineae bacterium]|nr:hypothetical protein [Anaerolineae bacterium]